MTTTGKLTEPTDKSTEENSVESTDPEGVDRGLAILMRLDAVSSSVPFHAEFLRYFTETHSAEREEEESDESEEETTVEKSLVNPDENNQQHEECSSSKKDEDKAPGEAEKSSDDVDQRSGKSDARASPPVCDSTHTADLDTLKPDSQDSERRASGTTDNTAADNVVDSMFEIIGETKKKRIKVQYCYEFNLLSMIFRADSRLRDAKRICKTVLFAMPDNFNALWNKVKLMVALAEESGECIDEEAEEILTQLEKIVSENGKQMIIAKAETAAMYKLLVLNSKSLIRCIQLHEEVLADENVRRCNQDEHVDSLPEKLVDFWKYDLVGAYAMLTNAKKELLAEYGFNHGEVLSRLEELVLAVDISEHIPSKMKAQTWVNLANTFEHYRQNYRAERFRQDIYDGNLSLGDCLANASAHDPDNATILLRTGRELRQRNASERELHEAIKYFEKALSGEDIAAAKRDIINHHMGLAYRSLWLLEEQPTNDRTTDDAYHSTRTARPLHPLRCRVIKPPDHPLDFDLVPPPYKSPPKVADFKILNPIARNPENPYLLKARKCFEDACLLDEDDPEIAESLYLMEIARTYLSTRDAEKAREYLKMAEKQPSSDIAGVDFVGNAVYENIGLLEESEMLRKGFNDVDAEKVKSFYRESIRLSTVSKTKPIVSFHYLLRVLYKQLEGCVGRNSSELDQMIIQNEYFLLYMALHEAEDTRDIVNFLAVDDFKIALIWSLIEQLNRRNHLYDAAAVFTYLSILVMAKQFTKEVKGVNLTSTEKERLLIQSAERVTLQRVEQPRYLPDQYRMLHALCENNAAVDDTSDCTDMEHTLTDLEKQKLDIVMKIIQPGFSPGYNRRLEQCY